MSVSGINAYERSGLPGVRLLKHALVAAAALALASCSGINLGGRPGSPGGTLSGTPDVQNQVDAIKQGGGAKVALLLPLSARGEAGEIARGIKEAGELALFDTNDPSIVLIPKDTRGTPGGAQAAAEEAIAEGAELILGPLFAGSVKAVAPVANAANVPVIAYSTDRTVAGKGVYLLSFLPGQEIQRVMSYAASRSKKRLAALLPGSPYGSLVQEAMVKTAPRHGIKLALVEKFGRSKTGVEQSVAKIAAADRGANGLDGLLIAEGGETLRAIADAMQTSGIDNRRLQLLGTGLWDQPEVSNIAVLHGGWYAGPSPSAKGAFERRFKSAYGRQPPRIASLAYDSVSLSVALAKNGPQGARFTPEILTNPEGFSGVDGLFRFMPNGLNQRGLAVMEVTPTGPRVVSQPPARFSGAGF